MTNNSLERNADSVVGCSLSAPGQSPESLFGLWVARVPTAETAAWFCILAVLICVGILSVFSKQGLSLA